MAELLALVRRNLKIYFKDRGTFFTSMITPLILLLLYAVFLGKIYKDSFVSNLPAGFTMDESIIDGTVGAQLMSSLLAVCCITVSFCSNLIMVNDRVTGAITDLTMAPVGGTILALGYYFATMLSALIICTGAMLACFVYLAFVGWYFTALDVFLLFLDVILMVNFGTALSLLICLPLKTQGQSTAVGTIISAGYGFICGAYMPIASFPKAVQYVVSFLPGTYGTSIIRNHAFRGVFEEMSDSGVPDAVVDGIADSVDCNLYFFDHQVPLYVSYIIIGGSLVLILAAIVCIVAVGNYSKKKKALKK